MDNVKLAMPEVIVLKGQRLVHHVMLEATVYQERQCVPNVAQTPRLVQVLLNALLVHLDLLPRL
jgi:hypothetical protein